MSALILPEQRAARLVAAPADANASILAVISRAASDPNVDIAKMQALLQMQRELSQRQAEDAFNDAMSQAQAEMRPISNDLENQQTRSRYASPMALDNALRPIYSKYGFHLSFDTDDSPKPEHIRILCHVSRAGYTKTFHLDMPADGKGAKGGDVMTRTHATGAAVSYGRRYLKLMVFDVATGNFDTDGNMPTETSDEPSAVLDWQSKLEEAPDKDALQGTWKQICKIQDKLPSAGLVSLRKLFAERQRYFAAGPQR